MLKKLQESNKIIPVVKIDSVDKALHLADALQEGGISIIEITLRTACAVEALAAVKKHSPDMTVLAGTVMTDESMKQVHDAGADGAISPALSNKLHLSAKELGMPFLPGVATPSEVLAGLEMGLTEFKLFPASVVGGIPMLKAIGSPIPEATFCPTGGLNIDNFMDYLSLPNVACIGGSWMIDQQAMKDGDWGKITELSRKAVSKLSE